VGGGIRVAIVAAHDIIDTGLRGILRDVPGVQLLGRVPQPGDDVDVVLYDALAMASDDAEEFLRLVEDGGPPIIVVGHELRPDLSARALAHGAVGSVSIDAPALEIVLAVRRVADTGTMTLETHELGWEASLTLREVDVLSAITQGLSNEETAGLLAISPNTLKTYIRTAYRKIDVDSRSQAVAWCLQHGFAPRADLL
jgi:DNA-binding NarL/FixJ family response regulator